MNYFDMQNIQTKREQIACTLPNYYAFFLNVLIKYIIRSYLRLRSIFMAVEFSKFNLRPLFMGKVAMLQHQAKSTPFGSFGLLLTVMAMSE